MPGVILYACCCRFGIDPDNFTQADLDRLQEILDDEDE